MESGFVYDGPAFLWAYLNEHCCGMDFGLIRKRIIIHTRLTFCVLQIAIGIMCIIHSKSNG